MRYKVFTSLQTSGLSRKFGARKFLKTCDKTPGRKHHRSKHKSGKHCKASGLVDEAKRWAQARAKSQEGFFFFLTRPVTLFRKTKYNHFTAPVKKICFQRAQNSDHTTPHPQTLTTSKSSPTNAKTKWDNATIVYGLQIKRNCQENNVRILSCRHGTVHR